MPGPVARLVVQVSAASLLLCTVMQSDVCAQGPVAVSARIGVPSRPMAGKDSGKAILAIRISGLPDVALRALMLDQIRIVEGAGREYTPSGFTVDTRTRSFLAQYTEPASYDLRERRYLFLVPPGDLSFELRLPSLSPVKFTASFAGPGR